MNGRVWVRVWGTGRKKKRGLWLVGSCRPGPVVAEVGRYYEMY